MGFFDCGSSDLFSLGDEYNDLTVTMLDNDFSYPGTVSLKKEGGILKVYAINDMPLRTSMMEQCKFVHCIAQNYKTIILFEANLRKTSNTILYGDTSKQFLKNFREMEVGFDFAFISNSYHDYDADEIFVSGFELKFPNLKDLIGDTITQGNILYGNNTDFRSLNLYEFSQEIVGLGEISVSYDYTHANNNIKTAKILHPKLSILFYEDISISSLKEEILRLYDMIAFLMGGDFDIEHIKVNGSNSHLTSQDDSVYISLTKLKKNNVSPILPFGINQAKWSSFSKLPTEIFNKYYQLSKDDQSIFEKYTRYKRLNTIEDRFLGYFRLLEKLTLFKKYYVEEESLNHVLIKSDIYLKKRLTGKVKDIKAFIKRIPNLNASKNNTETCLREFYNFLSYEIKEGLNITNPDFAAICKLRNDITHANYYELDDSILLEFERFIHSLLFLSLLKKLDTPLDVCLPVIHKFKNF